MEKNINKPIKLSDGEFYLTIDYNKTLEEAISEGSYGGVSERINEENFLPSKNQKKGKVIEIARLFYFPLDDYEESQKVNQSFSFYRDANLRELLAYGSLWPRSNVAVITYGSFYYVESAGRLSVPYITPISENRRLHTIFIHGNRGEFNFAMLAIRC